MNMNKTEHALATEPKWVFTFGAGRADGSAADRNLLGGKGAYLAEMSRLGLPVPPGFTISAEVCSVYYELGRKLPDELRPMVSDGARCGGQDRRRELRRCARIRCSCRSGRAAAPRCPA